MTYILKLVGVYQAPSQSLWRHLTACQDPNNPQPYPPPQPVESATNPLLWAEQGNCNCSCTGAHQSTPSVHVEDQEYYPI